jgi:hypothetical protein
VSVIRRALVGGVLCTMTAVGVGCGRGAAASSSDPVDATQARLAKVTSASLDMQLGASAGQSGSTNATSIELKGPFQAPAKDGGLPVARLESARSSGAQRTSATFISTGDRAWVEANGAVTEVQGAPLDTIRATTRRGADQFGGLHLSRWFARRQATTTAGDATTVSGTLDAPSAINDVFGLAGAFGAGTKRRTLSGQDADRVRQLVRSSHVELVTGASDRVLRSLQFDVTFAPRDSAEIQRLLPDLSSAGLRFSLRLADVGKPVHVAAP